MEKLKAYKWPIFVVIGLVLAYYFIYKKEEAVKPKGKPSETPSKSDKMTQTPLTSIKGDKANSVIPLGNSKQNKMNGYTGATYRHAGLN